MHPIMAMLFEIRKHFILRGYSAPHTLVLPDAEYDTLLALGPPKVGPNAEWLWVRGFTVVRERHIPLKACQCDGTDEHGCTFPEAIITAPGAPPREIYD